MKHNADVGRGVIGVADVTDIMVFLYNWHFSTDNNFFHDFTGKLQFFLTYFLLFHTAQWEWPSLGAKQQTGFSGL